MTPRHFPPPWTVEDNGACFIVRDAGGQALAYVYFEDEPGRRSAAKLLTGHCGMSFIDAVDGAHSAASKCQRVVA
jgi:hypothetical protein